MSVLHQELVEWVTVSTYSHRWSRELLCTRSSKTKCRTVVLPGIGAVGVTRLSSFSFVFCPFAPEDILICVGTDSSNGKRGPFLQVFLLIDERKMDSALQSSFSVNALAVDLLH